MTSLYFETAFSSASEGVSDPSLPPPAAELPGGATAFANDPSNPF